MEETTIQSYYIENKKYNIVYISYDRVQKCVQLQSRQCVYIHVTYPLIELPNRCIVEAGAQCSHSQAYVLFLNKNTLYFFPFFFSRIKNQNVMLTAHSSFSLFVCMVLYYYIATINIEKSKRLKRHIKIQNCV